ncbi:helix-turn-helix domain-containing protein [Serratia fonticola]|uniref:helix-turn-helix domain-containing protein n=1 Tax=Serratia fonticola TaxID=47917 RepID=UPI0036F210E6
MAALELPMLTLELRVEIAVLLRQDMSIRGIARQLSCFRLSNSRTIPSCVLRRNPLSRCRSILR